MQDLFRTYLNNGCSPEEAKDILASFNDPEKENLLKTLIAETLENDDDEDNNSQFEPFQAETFTAIENQLEPQNGKLLPFFRRKWFRVAAVAGLIAGVFSVYMLANKKNQQPVLVNTDFSIQPPAPGNNRAVLTLADGSGINLETASNGPLTKQGSTNIVKTADGQVVYKALNEKSSEVLLNSITTPRSGQYQLILSDGSIVWLNAASSLRFPATFSGKERKVVLTGEAYFEIAKNTSMPFKVEVDGKAELEVLGTRFNVNAYSDEPAMNTMLLEGRVKVMGLTSGHSHIITPGEQAHLNVNGQISINKDANTEEAIAWKNGIFHFSNSDLATVFRQLSRWYDVDIILEGKLPARQFNGEIQRDLKLSQILKLLEKNEVFCRLEGKKLIILQ